MGISASSVSTPLIDQFAGHALSGLLSNPKLSEIMGEPLNPESPTPEDFARWSYKIAEAMIKYRNKKK